MSILIPGLKMPPTMGIQIVIDCGHVWVKPFGGHPEKLSERAIELPPHGRLIDADALNDMINRSYPMTDRVDVHNGYGICQEMIKQLPTIVEAEGTE